MESQQTTSHLLPQAAPDCAYMRLLLFAMRRTAVGGIDDAFAAHAMFTGFGAGFRRPLVLLRAFMAEVSRVAAVKLAVAPCCCARVTLAECALIGAVAEAIERPQAAQARLAAALHIRSCLGLVTSAQALAAAFHDHGMPLRTID